MKKPNNPVDTDEAFTGYASIGEREDILEEIPVENKPLEVPKLAL